MDPEVLASLARWPNVPACYGWLTLDARGRWRIGEGGGEVVRHAGLVAFLNRNYGATERGEWYVQNGPQRVYVALARAPCIVRLAEPAVWQTHNGLVVQRVSEALVDRDGHVYLVCEHGLAGVDDRDLAAALDTSAAGGDAFDGVSFKFGGRQFRLSCVDAATLPSRFGFVAQPQAGRG